MGGVDLGVTYGRRDVAQTPRVQIQNMVLEPNPTNQVDGKTWFMRPGVDFYPSPHSGILRGIMQSSAGYPNKIFFVMGTTFYQRDLDANASVAIGPVAGGDTVVFAYHDTILLFEAGGQVHRYDGTNYNLIAMPNGESIAWVAYLAGYYLFGVDGSQVIYFMTATAAHPDALDFFSAETHSTNTVRAMVLNDQLVIFCEANTEFWQPSGDANLPFNRVVGQSYEKGLSSTQAVTAADNTLIFVGNDLVVYRAGATPQRVSNNDIEERLRVANAIPDAADPVIQLWTFLADGHVYVVLTIDRQGTFAYDVSTGSWLQWVSGDGPYWLVTYGATLNSNMTIGGNRDDTNLYQVDPALGSDLGGAIDWVLTGAVPIIGKSQRLDSLTVMTNAGHTGGGAPMIIALNISNDQGQTFSGPFTASNGDSGSFESVPTWRMLGQMKQPQCVLEFSGSALVPFRISYARYNESFAP